MLYTLRGEELLMMSRYLRREGEVTIRLFTVNRAYYADQKTRYSRNYSIE